MTIFIPEKYKRNERPSGIIELDQSFPLPPTEMIVFRGGNSVSISDSNAVALQINGTVGSEFGGLKVDNSDKNGLYTPLRPNFSPALPGITSRPMTWFLDAISYAANSTAHTRYFGSDATNSANTILELEFGLWATGLRPELYIYEYNGSPTDRIITESVSDSIKYGRRHIICYRYDGGSSPNGLDIFVDGQKLVTTHRIEGVFNSPNYQPGLELEIGINLRLSPTYGTGSNANIFSATSYAGQALTDGEVAFVSHNLYKTLKQNNKKYYIFGTGTSALNLLLQDALSSTNADNLAAQQTHELLTDNSESASESASLLIAQTQDLITDNSNSATFTDSKAVQQTHAITTLDALSQSNADNASISQAHGLAPTNAISSAIAGAIVMAVGSVVNLALSNSNAGSHADVINIQQLQNIALSDGITTSSAESIALMQTHLIAFADAISSGQADVLVVSQNAVINLILAHATTAGYADNLAIAETHAIQLSGADAAAIADSLLMNQLHQLILSGANAQAIADAINTLGAGLGLILKPDVKSVSAKKSVKSIH